MVNLPAVRFNTSTDAFTFSGIDYVGPFNIKASKFRVIKKYKAYVAIFVSLVTQAVHIELVES